MVGPTSTIRFAIDTGGTFTDIAVIDEATGVFFIDKATTTPENTIFGMLAAIDKAGIDLRTAQHFFVHGSTTALNALLEAKGVRTAYVATKGFRDVPEIGRFNRPDMYNPKYHKPRQIVPRELRFEVSERIDARGSVVIPLDEDDARAVARRIGATGVRAAAVCFLHAHRYPTHEQRVREIFAEEIPEVSVAISSSVAPEHREFERSMTTILNAYLAPVVERWISELERELNARGFAGEVILTRSDGGGMTASAARSSPINMLLSGPAGGVIGGVHMAAISDRRNLITMDVGGTSFDVAIIREGAAATQQHTMIGGYPALISTLDIRTIGAGGGSLAWIDPAGALHVGPKSAGAVPGPICYQRGGTEPTVTDAFLVNGYIDPQRFLGGEMKLDLEGARSGIKNGVGNPLRMPLMTASSGILRIATANMAEAVRSITAEGGDDPRDYAMLCFGGGGALFGSFIMDELSLSAAIVPIGSSAFSAWGMLTIDLRHDLVQSFPQRFSSVSKEGLSAAFEEMSSRGDGFLRDEGVVEDMRELHWSADMRYDGQEHVVSVPIERKSILDGALAQLYADFEKVYEGQYGYRLSLPAEFVNLRVKAVGKIPPPKIRTLESRGDGRASVPRTTRRAFDFLANEWQDYDLYDREELPAGATLDGPALVAEATTTTIVRRGQRLVVDAVGNLVITRN